MYKYLCVFGGSVNQLTFLQSHGDTGSWLGEITKRFYAMIKGLDVNTGEHDYLGSSVWTEHQRSKNNEVRDLMYFQSVAGVHKETREKLGREGLGNTLISKRLYIGSWHELFATSKGHREAICINGNLLLLVRTINKDQERHWLA